jgi:hypothetical protein
MKKHLLEDMTFREFQARPPDGPVILPTLRSPEAGRRAAEHIVTTTNFVIAFPEACGPNNRSQP